MPTTPEELLAELLALDVEEEQQNAPGKRRDGILSRVFGSEQKSGKLSGARSGKFPPDVAAAIVALARPGLYLDASDPLDSPPLGISRIGGDPDLPSGMDWPFRSAIPTEAARQRSYATDDNKNRWSWATEEQVVAFRDQAAALADFYGQAAPLHFLVQLNFAQLANAGAMNAMPDYPSSGMLYLFYDWTAQFWGFDPKDATGFQLLWHEAGVEMLTRQRPPEPLASVIANTPIAPRTLTGHPHLYLPDNAQTELEPFAMSDAMQDAYTDWATEANVAGAGPDFRLGGWPYIVQNPMETECALASAGIYCGGGEAYSDPENAAIIASSSDWLQLLQIDSDEDAGIMWGDSGTLYVWIRRQDLAARRFDKAWIILQCF